ncbi:arylsulfatase [Mesorhizobium sp. L-8-3]|uniref:arylsulfatase n=1 Tax=Mesorhizobium sp. L-8-3 TaxID=2744522 RepID=UPI001925BAE6|nr:arylsulfatase [Mesorhizobium sp. L-8-3]BCH26655.1 arylsulfatase [Mesorhizobium sp. L-8-3]
MMRSGLGNLALLALMMVPNWATAQEILPRPAQTFEGHIGLTAKDSAPDFPKGVEAPDGAPNILLIMTDDVGFAASTTFGGPVPTPTMDRLAQAGLRYTQFHTTALCSPTRAALLTGRNHHAVASGVVMELGTGYPGYNTLMPKSAGTFAEVLRQNGYNTAWYGKNHNVPDWQSSQAGPFDLWPTGLGFEYFYGFIGADVNQWAPALFEGTEPIEPPHGDPDYIFDEDMADKAIARIRLLNAMAPDKPWLAYYAPGTAHAPHHAPREWIARFEGQFDQGWDKMREETFARQKRMGIIPADTELTPRPTEIQAWDSLDADRKKVSARMMEVFAGALSHADHQIGRIIDAIEEMGELDNTLVIYIQGDNGASAEGTPQGLLNEMTIANNIPEDFSEILRRMDELGGPLTYNHFPVGWAHATNTPFQWTKQIASHFGGTRNGLVISWPARIKDQGGIRTQFHHVIDIAPTVLEAVGVETPAELNGVAQTPIEGVSMAYTFDDANAPSRHRTQYFEELGNRAIYNDGWVAATTPPVAPWIVVGGKPDVLDYEWELYNVAEDFSQAVNLAEKEPAKLRAMQDLFWIEAAKYNVLPLDNSSVERFDVSIRPSLTRGRSVFTYFPGQVRIPEGTAPDLKNKSFKIGADVEIPAGGANGLIATQGGRFNGWGLYLLDGRPVFHYNLVGVRRFTFAGTEKLLPGKHFILVDFKYDGGALGTGGAVTLNVDDNKVAEGRVDSTYPFRVSLDETFDVGEDTGTPVSEDYKVPFSFTGTLNRVLIRLSDTELTVEDEEQIGRAGLAIDVWK